jgi:hypothetical protein
MVVLFHASILFGTFLLLWRCLDDSTWVLWLWCHHFNYVFPYYHPVFRIRAASVVLQVRTTLTSLTSLS